MSDQLRRLSRLAEGQHGLLTLQQARFGGLSSRQVQLCVRSGRWRRVHRAVYAVSGAPDTWQSRALAACFGAPDGAAASHLTSAALAGLDVALPPLPDVTVGRGRSRGLPGVTVHLARLTPTDLTTLQGVPATTIARTLVDCAGIVGPIRLQRLVDQAFHEGLVTPAQISWCWDHARLRPGRAGEVRLRAAIEPWAGPIKPGSPAELRLRRQLVQWDFPEPDVQVPVVVGGRTIARIDLGWPDRLIGIEYDSERFHGPSRWVADEQRHAAISELGWTLLHAAKTDLRPGSDHLRSDLVRAWNRAVAA